jgi:hypothetical protein
VIPKTGETFQRWQDGSGKTVTTDKRYQFTMGAAASSCLAVYQGGGTGVRETADIGTGRNPSVSLSPGGALSIRSDQKINEVRIIDLSGREILRADPGTDPATLDLGTFTRGVYCVSVRSGGGLTSILVHR